jgi:hypothetical protein
MSTTGARYRQPVAKPGGNSSGAHIRNASRPSRHGGGSTGTRAASIPDTDSIPVRESAAIWRSTCNVSKLHARTRSLDSTRYGLHVAPAAKEVVAAPVPEAQIVVRSPASAKQTAVVSPDTPAPTTSTSRSSIARR